MRQLKSGRGLNRAIDLTAYGSSVIQGTLQAGIVDPATHAIDVGTFESTENLSGSGVIHVVATNGSPSALILGGGGALSLSAVTIDQGGQLNIAGSVLLSGVTTNSGVTVNNWGSTIWTAEGGNLGFANSAVFNNMAGALFDSRNDAELEGYKNADKLSIAGAGDPFARAKCPFVCELPDGLGRRHRPGAGGGGPMGVARPRGTSPAESPNASGLGQDQGPEILPPPVIRRGFCHDRSKLLVLSGRGNAPPPRRHASKPVGDRL